MTVLTCAITGKSITLLGEEIANSGEAKVWRTNQNGYLAKIYHSPTPERVQKLAVMIAHPPTEPNSHLNHISFAWPKSALKNAQGDCVGFLMPEIKDGKELLDVYNPRRRKALKLEIDWRFLHTTAMNIVSIIEALHAAGYVLGDIKPQNILVNNRALPSIIDTDSFQVINPKNGKIYHCLVGSEGYTPPELIGKDFDSIEQTEVHDRFRLGVIIYQLLFGGNSPFQGKWTGAGETPEPNEIIRRGLWLYSPNSLIEPVPRTIPMIIVHPEIRECFLKCFNDGHKNPNFRPTARDWLKALRTGNDNLTICDRIDSHYYSRTFGSCYWCDRSTNLGVDIFPGVVKAKPSVVVEVTSQSQVVSNKFIGNLLQTLTGHSDWVSSVAYSPDSQTLASGSGDNTIKLWNVKTGNLLQTLTGHSKLVYSVAYSPDGQTLASGSKDKTIKLWNVKTGNLLQTLTGHSSWVYSVSYSPDGQTLASGSKDKTIKLWNVKTGNLLQTLTGHSDQVRSVAYSPDGQTLASGSKDKTIKLWNVKTGNLLQTLTGHSELVWSVAYSPDGQTLASGSSDNTIKIWQVAASISKAPVQQTQSQVSQTPVSTPQSQPVITQVTATSTTNTSSSIQQPQSQVSQPAVYKPQHQTVITPSTATTISSSVQPTQSHASQTNQLVNSPRQVSQPPVFKLPSQPVTIPAPQTTIPVKNTKLRKLLIAAILGFIGTQIYGYIRYGLFPVNPISIIVNLPLEPTTRKVSPQTNQDTRNGRAVCRECNARYPESARRRGIEGRVEVVVDADDQGNVTNVRIARSSGDSDLDEETLKQARNWKLKPVQGGRQGVSIGTEFALRGSHRHREAQQRKKQREIESKKQLESR
ncbi:TonB family protein [Cronbergia sp. UHCC 0137]|uniref:TonB family protein n=1 Tax=Cronbergia sp. UHCC 0137 TaxID=3110239 RepID=UPI002B1EAB71|nr:TonB family protein [Cronbergia sp. UHCC 0137]MEA5619427.1 TonB family protein [Cronbergia sp. UHCC 0137]